jgi:hypothetical protein
MIIEEAAIIETLDPIATYRLSKRKNWQNPIAGGKTLSPNVPVRFDESISEQDYLDIKDGKKMITLKTLLVYSGPLDFR